MNLYRMLQERAAANKPLKVGLIGAGKFGTMYLAQARHTPGIHIVAIADLAPARAAASLLRCGWAAERFAAKSLADAAAHRTTCLTDNVDAMIAAPEIEIIIDATGSPAAGIHHVLECCRHRKHIVMVNVEADALAGPLLARKAEEAGIVYSLAYGDQPALICEMVDWCRAAGFEVVAAGKGTSRGRNARWRGWLHGLREAAAGPGFACPRWFAAGPGPRDSALERSQSAQPRALDRCRNPGRRSCRWIQAGDGAVGRRESGYNGFRSERADDERIMTRGFGVGSKICCSGKKLPV